MNRKTAVYVLWVYGVVMGSIALTAFQHLFGWGQPAGMISCGVAGFVLGFLLQEGLKSE